MYFLAFLIVNTLSAFVVADNMREGIEGNYSTFTELFLDKCPNLSPEAYAPACPTGLTNHCYEEDICMSTTIKTSLILDRFHFIDDLNEQFQVAGSLFLGWLVPCTDYKLRKVDAISLNMDPSLFWKPQIHHKNAASDISMKNGFANRFIAQGVFYKDEDAMEFLWQMSGVFTSKSALSHELFPFDEQQLSIDFILPSASCAASLEYLAFEIGTRFIPKNSGWLLVGTNYTTDRLFYSESKSCSLVSFNLILRRRPDYYIYNLMIPISFLTSLQLAAFMMPTKTPDRSFFAVTILMMLMFFQGIVLSRIPVKPIRVLLTNFTDLNILFSWASAIYSLITCGMFESPLWKGWLSSTFYVGLAEIRKGRLLDFCFCILGLIAFCAINASFNLIVAS